MPRKNPWTTTPSGTEAWKAWKLAQRIAMFAPQNPTAPPKAIAPELGWRTKAIAVRVPCAKVAGRRGDPLGDLAEAAGGVALDPALEVVGKQCDQQAETIASAARAAGITVPDSGASPERTPVRSSTPKTTIASR